MTNEMPRYDTDDDDVIEADVDNAKTTTDALNNVTFVATSDDLVSLIDNASTGDHFYLLPGTHTVSKSGNSAVEIVKDDLKIFGPGEVKVEDNASGEASTDAHAVIGIGVSGGASPDGVVIEDITVDGNKANNTNDYHAIGVFGATNYRIEGTECRNATDGGIKHDGADPSGDGGQILSNHVHDNEADAVFLGGQLRGAHNLIEDHPNQDGIEPLGDRQTWENNIVKNTSGTGFDCFDVQGVTVQNNIIISGDNGPSAAVSFNGGTGTGAEGCIFSGNVSIGAAVTGGTQTTGAFDAGTLTACEVSDNVFIGMDVAAKIEDDSILVADNDFVDCTATAINVRSSGAKDVVIRGNYIFNCTAQAIKLESAVSGVTVRDNTIIDGGSHGINVNGDDHDISDNKIVNCSSRGIIGSDGSIGLTIQDNTIDDCGSIGIDLDDVDDCRVIGNTLRNNTTVGIYFNNADSSTHSNITVKDNLTESNSEGIRFDEGTGSWDHVVLTDNIAKDGYNLTVSGVLFRNGTELLSGSDATASDYNADDVGREIVRTDGTPKKWVVDGASSLTQVV